jgi:hypothetical protein
VFPVAHLPDLIFSFLSAVRQIWYPFSGVWCRELSFALSLPLLCLPHLLPSPAARAVSSSRGSPFKTLTKVQSMLAANLFAARGALLHDNLVLYIYGWLVRLEPQLVQEHSARFCRTRRHQWNMNTFDSWHMFPLTFVFEKCKMMVWWDFIHNNCGI